MIINYIQKLLEKLQNIRNIYFYNLKFLVYYFIIIICLLLLLLLSNNLWQVIDAKLKLKLLYSPTDHLEVTNRLDRYIPPNRVTDGDVSRKSPSHDLEPLGPFEQTESLLDALRQVLRKISQSINTIKYKYNIYS